MGRKLCAFCGRFWRVHAASLARFWRALGAVLARAYRGHGSSLARHWRGHCGGRDMGPHAGIVARAHFGFCVINQSLARGFACVAGTVNDSHLLLTPIGVGFSPIDVA